ncbi:nuclear speckle splicing regulatory protein 1 [Neltuma alba]|uniref:nuclear speckle splicing regulatory protein 1 n=1 Tax=Neltuma alba TaxID=207710 RepID=UPI0010A550BE|nr:nuclear speckle splicing regulatory protein 1-like [Prosopis alba]XP_028766964.1 nuclear speckle splicing regulatory protein 1-like [Prosopis alba]XP_028766965.1 nuclear speckle splicing regulatory protein 1-like [Prosopis alba]XP_028766966.1 nuclear speckle splicing regulatory protein 1-like [Prosopis alba]
MSKYGLNLRHAQKKQPVRSPLATPFGFSNDDENDVEKEIARQASKNKALKEIEEQQKKALEEDPTVFDYDGVYDKMKQKIARPLVQDREERKPKYIRTLMQKAKEREQYRDIVYERKLAKERSKDDHLYADKDKFVTEAYRKKLAEREKQMELERLRELQEERDDVTKKKDFLLDFYSNLDKNIAYGAKDAKGKKHEDQAEARIPETRQAMTADPLNQHQNDESLERAQQSLNNSSSGQENNGEGGTSNPSDRSIDPLSMKPSHEASLEGGAPANQSSSTSEPKPDHHKRTHDALAAAKERFLARKRAKEQ